MKKQLKYCTYCGPEWVDWIIHDPQLGAYCSFCGFSLMYDEPDPQEQQPISDLGRCPTCGDDYVISDNFICCRCDMYPI